VTAFFVWLVFKPARAILRFFFYKVVVKFYGFYRRILKRLGWKGLEQNAISFLFSQKLVHVLVVSVTILLIIVNITPKTRAGGLTDRAHQTILADLIRSEFSEFEEDEQFIIESFDKEAVISSVQQTYLDNLGSFRPQARVSMGDEIEEEIDVATIQEGSSIVKPELAATKKTKRARTEIVEYEVLPGDTISTIAQEFEVSVRTILWRPGDKLKILPMSGVSHAIKKGDSINTIAKKYDVEEEEIMETNKLAKGDTLKIGQLLMIPGGSKVSQPSYTTKTYTGFSAIKDLVKAPNAQAAAGNKMNWPAAATRITQYYSWRHHAVDIAAKTGTAIYAADAGTVELVGWGSGYGNQIVINHGGGKKTRYAHLSKFYIKKGDTVSKGQTIAAMGSTGWSTGPHLHFEVVINGRKYNPLNYIR